MKLLKSGEFFRESGGGGIRFENVEEGRVDFLEECGEALRLGKIGAMSGKGKFEGVLDYVMSIKIKGDGVVSFDILGGFGKIVLNGVVPHFDIFFGVNGGGF